MSLEFLKIDQIIIPEERQRAHFPEEQMNELRDSISSSIGLLSPIVVRPTNKKTKFTLIAGERRLRAISQIMEPYKFGDGIVPVGTVPALVKHFDDDIQAMEAELHENIIRLDLTWQEKASAIAQLHRLKVTLNPKHTKSMTATMIEEKKLPPSQLPHITTLVRLNSSLLVDDFLDDPEVAGARDLKEASKIVSKKLEDEALKRLQEIQLEIPDSSEEVGEEHDVLDTLPTVTRKIGTLLRGDIAEQIKTIELGSVSVVVADPPYGIGAQKFKDSGGLSPSHEYDVDDATDIYQVLVSGLDDVCGPNAHVYIFCDVDYIPLIKSSFSDKWRVRRKPLVWNRQTGRLADGLSAGYISTSEYIIHASRGSRPYKETIPEVIDIRDVKHKMHPAEKPIELYQRLLSMSAIPGETVLDPFAGSGTIFNASRILLLNPIGIEIDEKYQQMCRMAQENEPNSVNF